MKNRTLALAALALTSLLSVGTANAYIGDGCGRSARQHIARPTGKTTCTPIFRPILRAPVAGWPHAVAGAAMGAGALWGGIVFVRRARELRARAAARTRPVRGGSASRSRGERLGPDERDSARSKAR